jgi:hypothetical protein
MNDEAVRITMRVIYEALERHGASSEVEFRALIYFLAAYLNPTDELILRVSAQGVADSLVQRALQLKAAFLAAGLNPAESRYVRH